MADVENQPRTRLQHNEVKTELKRLNYELTPGTPHNERVRAYGALRGLLEQVGSIPGKLQNDLKTLWMIVRQDILSSNEEIAAHSLRVLGTLLRRVKLTDTVERNLWTTLLAVITTTSSERICTLGLWCISMQELSRRFLVVHLQMTIVAVVHGIDNPLESMCITHVAFQALTRLTKQVPDKMHEHSISWVPPLYRKLLIWRTSEVADKCLSDVQAVMVPPTPELTEALVTDVQLRLLSKKSMLIDAEREAVSAVRAWSWLAKILGEKFLLEKTLIDEMPQVVEKLFTSPSAQVRNTSQVAWVSIIDAFVSYQAAAWQTEMLEASQVPSRGNQLLKLLMTPLVAAMSWEKVLTIQLDCCGTWIYFLCRLGLRVSEKSEFDTAVLPMLEAVFKLGPKRTDALVWATCVDVFRTICARNSSGDSCHQKAVQMPLHRNHSQGTPVGQGFEDALVGVDHQKIQWNLWKLDQFDSLLKLMTLLWSHGIAHPDKTNEELPVPKPEEYCFEPAFGCWRSLVQGVKAEEKSSVRPPAAHVTAVHLLLHFFSWACKSCPSRLVSSTAWQLAEILIEVLQPVILTSSFYKLQLPLEKLARYVPERPIDAVLFKGSMVTPIVFISAVWFDFIMRSELGTEPEDLVSRTVASIISTARSGFDVMGTFQGLAWMLDCLGIESSSFEDMSPGTNTDSMKGDLPIQNWDLLLNLWRIVADQLREHVDRPGDFPSVEPGAGDSNYKVTSALLLFPVKYLLCLYLREYHESRAEEFDEVLRISFKCAVSETQLQTVESTWFKLYDSVSRVSSGKPSSSNAFIGGLFKNVLKILKQLQEEETNEHSGTKVSSQGLRLLGDVVIHAIKHAEIPNSALLAISRKRRKVGFGAYSVRVQYLGGIESEDISELRDLFIVASKLLTLSYGNYNRGKRDLYDLDVVIRLFRALAGVAEQTTCQNDALRLLKVFSHPLTLWLGIGGKDGASGLTVESLQDALAEAWDGLSSCLQTCHPSLTFDSALLDVQAPTLSLALLHTHGLIADRAVSFWVNTYGRRVYPLKYPPVLMEAFCNVRHKVEVPLPGWGTGTGAVKQRFQGSVYSRHPLAKFMPQTTCRDPQPSLTMRKDIPCKNLTIANPVSPQSCSDVAARLTTGTVRNPLHDGVKSTQDLATLCENLKVVEDREHLVNGADEGCPPSMSKGGSLLAGDSSLEDVMNVVNSTLKKFPEQVTSNSSAASSVGAERCHTTEARTIDNEPSLVQNVRSEQEKSSIDDGCMPSVHEQLQVSQPVVAGKQVATDKTTALSCASPLVTPPITSIEVPHFPPKLPAGGGNIHNTVAIGDPTTQVSTMNPPVSQRPCRRKKVKFQQEAQDVLSDAPHLLQEPVSAPPANNTRSKIQNRQRTANVETHVHISGTLNCDVSLVPPAGVTELEECAVDGTGSLYPAVSQNLDFDLDTRIASKQGKLTEPPRRCPEVEESSAVLRSNVPNDLDLVQMKEKLASLSIHNPTLTFRELIRAEQYDTLARPVLVKLKKHLDELKTRSRVVDDTNTVASGEGARASHSEESQYIEEELRVTVDAVNHAAAEDDGVDQSKREDASAACLLDQDAGGQQFSDEEGTDHSILCVHCSTRRRSRRISEMRPPNPKSGSRRSNRKLRRGRQWRTDAEAERSCTSLSGRKKETARRRRSLNSNSVPLTEERIECAQSARKGFRGKCLACRAKILKVPISQLPEVKQATGHQVLVSEDPHHYDDDSGFRIRQLHRGMFEMSSGSTDIAEFPKEVDAEQKHEQIIRSNHSRKGRFPKRVHPSPCSERHNEDITTDAADVMKVNELPLGEICTSPVTMAATERVELLNDPLLPPAERLSPQQQTSSIDHQSQDENSSMDSLNIDDSVCRTPSADCVHGPCLVPESEDAENCNHPESVGVSRKLTDLSQEIERLLRLEDIQVYHVLAALAASPQWLSLTEVEVVEAEKTISTISKMLAGRKERSESPKFTTAPTHGT